MLSSNTHRREGLLSVLGVLVHTGASGALSRRRFHKTDVCALRGRLGLSQAEFAQRFFLSVRTVQQWERGAREPSEAARVFLYAISKDPAAIEHILHAT